MATGYPITYWQNHVTQYINRYTETDNGDGTVTQTPVEGEVIQQGTPQNAANFNNMEFGIFGASNCADFLQLQSLHLRQSLERQAPEIGTVTAVNAQALPFNSSGVTVALSGHYDNADYFVAIEPLSASGGAAGVIEVYNKLRNGFGVRFSGSASSAVLHYCVTGGKF